MKGVGRWRVTPHFVYKEEDGVFVIISLFESNRKHRTIKRGLLDELVGIPFSTPYTSYHHSLITLFRRGANSILGKRSSGEYAVFGCQAGPAGCTAGSSGSEPGQPVPNRHGDRVLFRRSAGNGRLSAEVSGCGAGQPVPEPVVNRRALLCQNGREAEWLFGPQPVCSGWSR